MFYAFTHPDFEHAHDSVSEVPSSNSSSVDSVLVKYAVRWPLYGRLRKNFFLLCLLHVGLFSFFRLFPCMAFWGVPWCLICSGGRELVGGVIPFISYVCWVCICVFTISFGVVFFLENFGAGAWLGFFVWALVCRPGLEFVGGTLFFVMYLYFTVGVVTRAGAVAKMIMSTANRPIVKTDILRIKAAGNAVASMSNGFAVRIPIKTGLSIDCVNCGARRVMIKIPGACGIVLGRSTRVLSRIIIANCKVDRGHSLVAGSVSGLSSGMLRGTTVDGTTRSLRKAIDKLHIAGASNGPNDSPGVILHNNTSVGGGLRKPLIIISNLIHSVSSVGPSSVRSVRILGSTTSATVCNTHTGGNMVLIAAGGKIRNEARVACGFGKNIGFTHRKCGCLSTNSCLCCRHLN